MASGKFISYLRVSTTNRVAVALAWKPNERRLIAISTVVGGSS
jgi:hypothetical protein